MLGRDVPTVTDLEATLRAAALRVTRPRLAVLAAVHEHPHADTHSIIGAVRVVQPGVSHQAVYDVLRVLTDAHLVRRIQPPGSVARYEARVADNHHHLVCRGCGAVVDVDCAVGQTPCLTPSASHGFVVHEAEVVYWGHCPACVAAPRPNGDADASAGPGSAVARDATPSTSPPAAERATAAVSPPSPRDAAPARPRH